MVRLTHLAVPLAVGALFLTACPGDDAPQETNGSSGTGEDPSTGPGPATTTIEPDTDPGSDTSPPSDTTEGGIMCEPACGAGECCVEGLCFDAPEPVCEGGCAPTEACLCPEGSDPCDCVASCVSCGVAEASYDPCLDVECPAGSTCLADDPANPTFAVCAVTGCGGDACACPLPPGTGTAVNNCGDFGGTDACFLDCSDATCPDDMVCRNLDGQNACVWPGEGIESNCCFPNPGATGCDDMTCQDAVCAADSYCCETEWDQLCVDAVPSLCPGLCPVEGEIQPLYGDCINEGLVCDAAMGHQCLSDGTSFGWCGIIGCMDDMDCEPAPATGTAPATCTTFNDGMGGTFDACALLCDMGQTCPDGMSCFMDSFCVWDLVVPPPPTAPGYGDCVDNPLSTCQAGEDTCLVDNAGAPTAGACSESGCADATDCLAAPPTGNAPVTCGDLGTGNTCYLDCSAGQTCPDGSACTAVGGGMACLWTEDGFVLDEDFEQEAFRPSWSLINVDGNTPDPAVAYVNDAWVVVDNIEAGVNFAAYSTSWYAPFAQADDWMITPQIHVGAASTLSWVARAPDAAFADGYTVYISTGGPTIPEFTANASLFTIPSEAAAFTPHSVDLAAAGYTNQDVYIAFRNNSNDDFILMVDNIQVTQ